MGLSVRNFRICASFSAGLSLVWAVCAHAQEEAPADQLQSLRDCMTIQSDSERLTCFDQAVKTVISLEDRGEISIVDKEAIAETRRGLFGFSLPKTGVFGASDTEVQQVLNSRIVGLRKLRSDHWEIEISEGSVWQATNTPRRFKPKVGSKVELEQAALSSYWLRVDGQLGVKASRIR